MSQPPVPPPPPSVPAFCRSCGSPLAVGARFCATCGAEVPPDPATGAGGPGDEPPKRSRTWLVVLGLVCVAAGVAAAIALTDEGDGETTAATATTAARTAPRTVTVTQETTTVVTQPGATTTATVTTPTPQVPGDWPGGSAWTIVVDDEARSEAAANQALAGIDLPGAPSGALRSDDFEDVGPGPWVAFVGTWSSSGGAQAQLGAIQQTAPDAAVVFVQPAG